jgi:hypothetical protein
MQPTTFSVAWHCPHTTLQVHDTMLQVHGTTLHAWHHVAGALKIMFRTPLLL